LYDAIFLPTQGGVKFKFRGTAFTVKGHGVYELFSKILPYLRGDLTVSELCSYLDSKYRQNVQRLMAILIERRVVIDRIDNVSHLNETVMREFRAQIEFIEHFTDNPVARFERFKKSPILLIGSGVPLTVLVLFAPSQWHRNDMVE
jgi:hypothetical protein